MHDLADVVRTLAVSLVLDACGGWIGLQALGTVGSPGLEVVAFDRRCAHTECDERGGHDWPHLRSQLQLLGHLGAAVKTRRTPRGGTALWTRIDDGLPGAAAACATAPDVSGLLQAPPGDARAGWMARRQDGHLGIVVCEAAADAPVPVAAAQRLLHTTAAAGMEGHFAQLGHLADDGSVSAVVLDVDLANRAVRAERVGRIGLTLLPDGVGGRPPVREADGAGERETSVHWERTLTIVAHTAGIGRVTELPTTTPVALTCADLMRDERTDTPTACVVAARVGER
jgi:hypothetical protein